MTMTFIWFDFFVKRILGKKNFKMALFFEVERGIIYLSKDLFELVKLL